MFPFTFVNLLPSCTTSEAISGYICQKVWMHLNNWVKEKLYIAQNLRNFVSKSNKGEMGKVVREKPNKSKESAYKSASFGV